MSQFKMAQIVITFADHIIDLDFMGGDTLHLYPDSDYSRIKILFKYNNIHQTNENYY